MAQSRSSKLLLMIAAVARELNVAICMGYAELDDAEEGKPTYNSAAVFDRDGQLALRK